MRALPTLFVFGAWLGCTPPIAELDEDESTSTMSGGNVGDGTNGADCENGVGIIDCEANCWSSSVLSLLGDGRCDEGERGPDFACVDWSDDEGDCPVGGDAGAGEDTSGEDGGTATGAADAGAADAGAADTTGGSEDAGDDGTSGSTDEGGSSTDAGDSSGSDEGSGTDDGTGSGGTGSDDGTGSGGTGSDDGGGADTFGGCEFADGDCVNGIAAGECTGFGGTWYAAGCPTECYDSYVVDGYYYDSDPSDVVYSNTFEPSCRSGSGVTDVAYAWSPPFDGEYCFTALVGVDSEDMGIAPVLSIWNDDCVTERACLVGDPSDSAAMVFHTGVFYASETYRVVIEHYRSSDVGDFSLIIDSCPVWTK